MTNDEKILHSVNNADNLNKLFKLRDGLWYIRIEKNGSSTLDSIANKYGAAKGYEHCMLSEWNNVFYVDAKSDVEGTRFVVYRDPVDRFCSFYANKIMKASKSKHFSSLVKACGLVGCSVDKAIDFIEKELNYPNKAEIDPHIRRQCDFFDMERIDVIVEMKSLGAFLTANGLPVEHINPTYRKIMLTPHQEQRLRTLYSADYEILQSPKLWKPCTTSVQ